MGREEGGRDGTCGGIVGALTSLVGSKTWGMKRGSVGAHVLFWCGGVVRGGGRMKVGWGGGGGGIYDGSGVVGRN